MALVVGLGSPTAGDGVDVWTSDFDALWHERLLPFAENLAHQRRAPRRQQAVHAAPDPTWPAQATRIIARLKDALGEGAVRIGHIGSTSVPGLAAKDLIDVQIVVRDPDSARDLAPRGVDAGLVEARGRWFGLDQSPSRGSPSGESVSLKRAE